MLALHKSVPLNNAQCDGQRSALPSASASSAPSCPFIDTTAIPFTTTVHKVICGSDYVAVLLGNGTVMMARVGGSQQQQSVNAKTAAPTPSSDPKPSSTASPSSSLKLRPIERLRGLVVVDIAATAVSIVALTADHAIYTVSTVSSPTNSSIADLRRFTIPTAAVIAMKRRGGGGGGAADWGGVGLLAQYNNDRHTAHSTPTGEGEGGGGVVGDSPTPTYHHLLADYCAADPLNANVANSYGPPYGGGYGGGDLILPRLQLSAGAVFFLVACRDTKSVYAGGINQSGQLGVGSDEEALEVRSGEPLRPVAFPQQLQHPVWRLVCGGCHTVALVPMRSGESGRAGGGGWGSSAGAPSDHNHADDECAVWVWGRNTNGQLGIDPNLNPVSDVPDARNGDAGKSSSHPRSVTAAAASNTASHTAPFVNRPHLLPPSRVTAINAACGDYFTVLLSRRGGGSVGVFGKNTSGQLGVGGGCVGGGIIQWLALSAISPLLSLGNITSMACGGGFGAGHTIITASAAAGPVANSANNDGASRCRGGGGGFGLVFGAGSNAYGQLGATVTSARTPTAAAATTSGGAVVAAQQSLSLFQPLDSAMDAAATYLSMPMLLGGGGGGADGDGDGYSRGLTTAAAASAGGGGGLIAAAGWMHSVLWSPLAMEAALRERRRAAHNGNDDKKKASSSDTVVVALSRLDMLPPEVRDAIITYLPPRRDALALSAVSRLWRDHVRHCGALWGGAIRQRFPLSYKRIEATVAASAEQRRRRGDDDGFFSFVPYDEGVDYVEALAQLTKDRLACFMSHPEEDRKLKALLLAAEEERKKREEKSFLSRCLGGLASVGSSSSSSSLRLRLFGGTTRQPHLLMIGLDAAGKTTILHRLRRGGAEVETGIPTIGFNVETLTTPLGMSFVSWDVGGPDRIRAIWRHYLQSVDGIVLVVDANDRERTTTEHLERHLRRLFAEEDSVAGAPVLVLSNKMDLPNAMMPEEVAVAVGPIITGTSSREEEEELGGGQAIAGGSSSSSSTSSRNRDRRWCVQPCCAGFNMKQPMYGVEEGLEWIMRQLVVKRSLPRDALGELPSLT